MPRGAALGGDLAHERAERARMEVPRVAVARAQSGTAVFSVSGMSRHESSRGAARPKKARPERKVGHNGTALLPRDAEVEARNGTNSSRVARRASRVATAVDGRHALRPQDRRDARETARASFFGTSRVRAIARSRSTRPSRDGASRRHGRHSGAHQAHAIVRVCSRAPPARPTVFASSVSSVSSRLVQADPRHGSVSFSVERLPPRFGGWRKESARARGDPRREPGRLHESARRLRRRVRSEPAWRPSRDSRRRRGARLAEPNERSRGRTTKRIWNAGTRAPKTSVPRSLQVLLKVKKNPSRRRCASTPARRLRSRSASRACAPRASPSRAPRPAGTSCGSRSACGRSGVVFLRASNAKRRKREEKRARAFSGASSAAPRRARRAVKSIATENAPKTLRNRDPQPQNRRRLYRRASLPKRERFVRRRSRRPGG